MGTFVLMMVGVTTVALLALIAREILTWPKKGDE